MIDEQNFFDQPVTNSLMTYDSNRKIDCDSLRRRLHNWLFAGL